MNYLQLLLLSFNHSTQIQSSQVISSSLCGQETLTNRKSKRKPDAGTKSQGNWSWMDEKSCNYPLCVSSSFSRPSQQIVCGRSTDPVSWNPSLGGSDLPNDRKGWHNSLGLRTPAPASLRSHCRTALSTKSVLGTSRLSSLKLPAPLQG